VKPLGERERSGVAAHESGMARAPRVLENPTVVTSLELSDLFVARNLT